MSLSTNTTNTKVLIVEDDDSLGNTLRTFLRDEGYNVDLAQSIGEARERTFDDYELMILDWMLPDGQGIDFLRTIRSEGVKLPVIMLTARTEVIDKVVGLESGADDYLTKPFEPRELAARIRVQLRHSNERGVGEDDNPKIKLGDLIIDKERREVSFKGKITEFTKWNMNFFSFSRKLLIGPLAVKKFLIRFGDTKTILVQELLTLTFFKSVKNYTIA